MIIKKNKIRQKEDKKREEKIIKQASYAESYSTIPEEDANVIDVPDANEEDVTQIEPALPPEPEVDLFDIEHIDFEQRQERRRGTRRRGYRRIDDRNLVSRAQEEAETIKKSAFEEGYQKGLEQASADMQKLKSSIQDFMSAPKEVFEYIAPDILEISVDIAKRIIKKEMETDPQVIVDTIIDVLKTVSKSEPKINIRVNPQAANFIKDTLPSSTYQYGIDAKINIISDPSVEAGGCIFQTNNGIVDASVDTQIEIIKKALEGI